jgi:hypothetical protein
VKLRSSWLAIVMGFALAACGDDNPSVQDGSPGSDAIDAPMPGNTFTTFVIDLVQNKTADNTDPVAFDQFSTLPDPDGDNNNTAAYDPLFP